MGVLGDYPDSLGCTRQGADLIHQRTALVFQFPVAGRQCLQLIGILVEPRLSRLLCAYRIVVIHGLTVRNVAHRRIGLQFRALQAFRHLKLLVDDLLFVADCIERGFQAPQLEVIRSDRARNQNR